MVLPRKLLTCALAAALVILPLPTQGQDPYYSVKPPALSASSSGSLSVVGYTNLSIYDVGQGPKYEGRTGNVTGNITSGNYLNISFSELNWGPFFGGGSCLSVDFNSSLNPLNLGVITKLSFQTALGGKLCCSPEIKEDYLQSIPGANTPEWRNVRNLSAVVALSEKEDYKYVVKALGDSGNSTVTYRVTVHDKSDEVCQTVNGAAGKMPPAPAPSPASASAPQYLPYFETYNELTKGDTAYPFTFVNISCLSIQMPAQADTGSALIDWRTFLIPAPEWSRWIANSTALQYPPVPSVGTCVQTSDTSDASSVGKLPALKNTLSSIVTPQAAWAYPSQDCQINIDNLNPKQIYILFTANNANASAGYIRVAAKATGSCARVILPNTAVSTPELGPSFPLLPTTGRGPSGVSPSGFPDPPAASPLDSTTPVGSAEPSSSSAPAGKAIDPGAGELQKTSDGPSASNVGRR